MNIKIKYFFTTLLLVLFFQLNVTGQTTEELIDELLEVQQIEKITRESMEQSMGIMRQQIPNITDEKVKLFIDKSMEKMIPMLRKITLEEYPEVYSNDELKELIKFYKTPIGQKSIKLIPIVQQRSMKAGAEIGQKMMMEVLSGN